MKKETYEWIHSWCDQTLNEDLPRVLLVGDSITYGYEKIVREKLQGICYVDFISTSHAIDKKIYNILVRTLVSDSNYKVVHFNHGLHGSYMTKRTYKSKMIKLLDWIRGRADVILATSTHCNTVNNERPDPMWSKKVQERNDIVVEYAKENGCLIDDLFSVSVKMPLEKRYSDGIHYTAEGYEIFAESVATSIKRYLNISN